MRQSKPPNEINKGKMASTAVILMQAHATLGKHYRQGSWLGTIRMMYKPGSP